jgi:hypothetical protein
MGPRFRRTRMARKAPLRGIEGGADGTRTRDPRRDRPILVSSGMSEYKRAAVKTAIYLNSAGVR